jgi:hypothetical protein
MQFFYQYQAASKIHSPRFLKEKREVACGKGNNE